jgi:two-component system alkaline phosphatase synthesis response regulator PhoP
MKTRKKLLYVDDDEPTLNIVSKFLISKGFEVLTSTNPFVAPTLEKEAPDLLILDINMPLLSGDRIADILARQKYTDTIPIVFFSSEPMEKIARIAGRIPTASYVTKESGLEQLVSKIRSILA